MFEDLDFQLEELDTSAIGAVEFEKLILHLLDEMGFRELVWRKGGEGNSATDGGRDLEAQNWSVGPVRTKVDKYWFEVKFRTSQLEKMQVQAAVLNANGRPTCDHLVIVTNTTVSNPCLDWMKDAQSTNRSLTITIWQGHDLELILRKNPRTLARFFPTALSFSGRCKVIESRFMNLFLLPSPQELEALWEAPDLPAIGTYTLLAAVFAEVAYGDIELRRWGMRFSPEFLHALLALSLVNIQAFLSRCISHGHSVNLFINGVAYLVMSCLIRGNAKSTADFMIRPAEWLGLPPENLSNEELADRWDLPLQRVYDILAQRCSEHFCMKLKYSPSNDLTFFDRFRAIDDTRRERQNEQFLVLMSTRDDCRLGLVARESFCPLFKEDNRELRILPDDLESHLHFAESVLRARTAVET